MKLYTVEELITKFGGQKSFSDLCNVSQSRVSQMKKDHRLSLKAAKSLTKNTKLKIGQLPIGA